MRHRCADQLYLRQLIAFATLMSPREIRCAKVAGPKFTVLPSDTGHCRRKRAYASAATADPLHCPYSGQCFDPPRNEAAIQISTKYFLYYQSGFCVCVKFLENLVKSVPSLFASESSLYFGSCPIFYKRNPLSCCYATHTSSPSLSIDAYLYKFSSSS